jgi:hypothetical protein
LVLQHIVVRMNCRLFFPSVKRLEMCFFNLARKIMDFFSRIRKRFTYHCIK